MSKPSFRGGLLEKSKKLLSGNREPSPGNDITSDSTSEAKARYQRRRDQVRRAQRSHRERKENYIKALEQEVLELRTNPASRVKALQAQISYLKSLLSANGIALPENWASEAVRASQAAPNAVAWFSDSDGSNTEIRIATPAQAQADVYNQRLARSVALNPCLKGTNYALAEPAAAYLPNDPLLAATDYFSSISAGQATPTDNPDSTVAPAAITNGHKAVASPEPRNAEMLAAAVEFILILERGCMSHYHMVVPTPDGQPGHGLLASHHILGLAPQGVAPGTNWQIPEATLENLLSLSTQFDLGGEITPVQAWHKLKCHDRFNELTPALLQRLAGMLKPEVHCYGFGAVIEKSVFDTSVDDLFACFT